MAIASLASVQRGRPVLDRSADLNDPLGPRIHQPEEERERRSRHNKLLHLTVRCAARR